MKKSESELTKLFEEKISFMFDESKRLPSYGQDNPVFIVRPKQNDTYQKIQKILSELRSDIIVESFRSFGNAHVIRFDTESKIVIIYAKNEADFKWMYDFHSYSTNIIIGKILKTAGLKYSEDGLQYIQNDLRENHKVVVGTIDITKDFSKILQILELDPKVFYNGFTSINEVFLFLVSSPYFYAQKFVNYEKEQRSVILQKLEEYLILNKLESKEVKKITFEHIKEFFPEIEFDRLSAELLAKAERKKGITDKFNGRVIMQTIPGFETNKIGLSMSCFKHSFESVEKYTDFLAEHSQEEVMVRFKEVNQIA